MFSREHALDLACNEECAFFFLLINTKFIHYNVLLFLLFLVFGTAGCSKPLFWNRSEINSVLGGMRNVVSTIISHEQTKSNRVCCFVTLNAVFPRDLFFRLLPK